MKPLRIIVAGLAIVCASAMQAQVSVSLNIGARPAWGPVVESDVRYYYLPEVDAYYDIPSSMFIYMDNGRWIHKHHLPGRYHGYDLYRGRKVVVYDYRGDSPYAHCRYPEYRRGEVRDYDRHERGYYRDNDRHRDEIVYRGNGRFRDNDDMRDGRDHDRGRGHAYGRNKSWKD